MPVRTAEPVLDIIGTLGLSVNELEEAVSLLELNALRARFIVLQFSVNHTS